MTMTSVHTANATIDLGWQLFLTFAIVVVATLLPVDSFAASSNGFDTVLCNVVNMFHSKTGKAIATVAVIAVGVGALMGKLSWGMALIIAIGIALIFGASGIVSIIGKGSGSGVDSSCG